MSGTCGENLTWELTESGTLTISGTGPMDDYADAQAAPWHDWVCSGIRTLCIKKGVTSIGSYAFAWCGSLISLELPSTLVSIGESAFEGCAAMWSLTVPNGVETIGANAFASCTCLGSAVLPNSVTELGEGAFAKCFYLYSVRLSAHLTRIEARTFAGCANLLEVTVPGSVEEIDLSAFDTCQGLEYLNISTVCKNYRTLNGLLYDGTGETLLFCPRGRAGSYSLPKGPTVIGERAFAGCRYLKSISLPGGLTEIGDNAFENCSALENAELPSSLTSIGKNVFEGCSHLLSVNYAGHQQQWDAIEIDDENAALQIMSVLCAQPTPTPSPSPTPSPAPHVHRYTYTIVRDTRVPTLTLEYEVYTCECGESHRRLLNVIVGFPSA